MISREARVVALAFGIGVAGVGALGVALASKSRPPAVRMDMVSTTRIAAEEQNRRKSTLGAQRHLVQRADSLQRVLARHDWSSDSLLIVEDSLLPAWERSVTTTLLRRSWAGLVPRHGGIRVAVAVVRETAAWQGGNAVSGILLPSMLDGRTCLVVLARTDRYFGRQDSLAELSRLLLDETATSPSLRFGSPAWVYFTYAARRASFGACGWLAAYGAAGAGVQAWLDSTGWRAAEAARFIDTPRARAPWRYTRAAESTLEGHVNNLISVPREETLEAQACAHDSPATCARLMLLGARAETPWRDSGVLLPGRAFFWPHVGVGSTLAHDPRDRFLDDLRRSIGAEKFGALWRDPRPFPDAFAAVVGDPLGVWTSRWMTHSIRGPGSDYGPAPSLRPWVFAIPVLCVFLWGAVQVARRRQVGR